MSENNEKQKSHSENINKTKSSNEGEAIILYIIVVFIFFVSYFIMYEDNSPIGLKETIKVMNENDGKFTIGEVTLKMRDVSDEVSDDYKLHIPSYFKDNNSNVVAKEFTLSINDEVIKTVTHKHSDNILDLDEYSTIISKEIREEYRKVELNENNQKEENQNKLKMAIKKQEE